MDGLKQEKRKRREKRDSMTRQRLGGMMSGPQNYHEMVEPFISIPRKHHGIMEYASDISRETQYKEQSIASAMAA